MNVSRRWQNLQNITTDMLHIDILVAHFVQHQTGLMLSWRQSIRRHPVRPGPTCTGTIGIALGNINPERISLAF